MEGWIKLHRQMLEWEWYNVSYMVHLFCHIVLCANRKDGEWRGTKVKRGQFVTGLNSLNMQTGIPVQKLRTGLERLKKTGEIQIKVTNKYSIITVCKYENYQPKENESNKQITIKQQSNNNKQEEKEIKKRYADFKNEVLSHKNYSKEMLEDFIRYWIEPNKSKTKMRFEMQPTWSTSGRLATWSKNDKTNSNDKPKSIPAV